MAQGPWEPYFYGCIGMLLMRKRIDAPALPIHLLLHHCDSVFGYFQQVTLALFVEQDSGREPVGESSETTCADDRCASSAPDRRRVGLFDEVCWLSKARAAAAFPSLAATVRAVLDKHRFLHPLDERVCCDVVTRRRCMFEVSPGDINSSSRAASLACSSTAMSR